MHSTPETLLGTCRRRFLAFLAAVFGALLVYPRRLLASASGGQAASAQWKWGMVIDLDRCTGCQGCVVACRAENNVPCAGPQETAKGRAIFWMNMLTVTEGAYPDIKQNLIPAPCNHCEDPPCIKVCPVGATTQSADGITQQVPGRCIGCRLCQVSCPYTRRYFNWSHPHWPQPREKQLNPEVAVRPHGVIEKCTFCHQRIRTARERARAEGRELRDAEVTKLTACAQSCPADAIVFGNLNDPASQVAQLARSPRAFRLLHELGTHPKVIYLREAKWQE